MLNRREFLKLNGLLAFLPWSSRAQDSDAGKDKEEKKTEVLPKDQLRVLQGATDSSSTIMTLFISRETQFYVQIENSRGKSVGFTQELIDFNYGDYVIYQLFINNLELKTEYRLAIYDRTNQKSYFKSFKALDLSAKESKIALLSCANYKKATPQDNMCTRLGDVDPDVIFFLGDLVYANSSMNTYLGTAATPEECYLAYTKTLLSINLYSHDKLVPIFSIHDDHDLGKNNSDRNIKYKEIMLKMFRSFFPVDSRIPEVQQGPGNSFVLKCFGMLMFFFDTRSFKDKEAGVYLGSEQLSWMKKNLENSQLPVMLISTQQFWNYRYLAESYQSTSPEEFQELILFLSRAKQRILFISGDVHYSQIQSIPYDRMACETYEITSSAFFSSSARSYGKRGEADGQMFYYGHPNFIILDKFQVSENRWSLNYTCHTEKNKNYFSRQLEIIK